MKQYEMANINQFKRITVNPNIMVGKPVIKGTRIPVYIILNMLGEDYDFFKIIKTYPDVNKEDILESLKFAAHFTKFEEIAA